MKYHINYNFVWLYFDKFYWGLLLGIELAAVSILIGSVIGLSLALLYVDGPRWLRRFGIFHRRAFPASELFELKADARIEVRPTHDPPRAARSGKQYRSRGEEHRQ